MKKRIISALLALLLALNWAFPALAAGEDFTYAITVNGSASATVKVGETVQAALTLTCNTGDSFDLYAMQDYVKFDPECFSLDKSSIQVYQDASSAAVFWAAAQNYGNGVDQVFVNHVSTTPVTLGKTVTVMTFELKALKTGTTTLTHEFTELSDGQGGQHSMEKITAAVTIQNSSDGGSSGSSSGATSGGSSSGTASGSSSGTTSGSSGTTSGSSGTTSGSSSGTTSGSSSGTTSGSSSGTTSGGRGGTISGGSSGTISGGSSGTTGGTAVSPFTGDNIYLFIWIAMLLVSGGVLTTLGIRKKHGKTNSR